MADTQDHEHDDDFAFDLVRNADGRRLAARRMRDERAFHIRGR